MATHFKLDGTTSTTSEDVNSQEELKNEVIEFASKHNDNMDVLRDWRTSQLKETDWMAYEDSPPMSDEWKTYRQKLRNLPVSTDANLFRIPDADFPIAPGESEIASDALKFCKSSDPLGIATTSWIGITTTGEYFRQNKPTIDATVSSASTIYSAASTTNIEFKVNTVNMAVEAEYPWRTMGSDPVVDKLFGYVKIVPDPTTHQGIGTVSVAIGSSIYGQVTMDGNIEFNVNVDGLDRAYTVGVTT
tara:strand:+ start:4955 stop:5692 length:738 start_codon:yes stop_codon:yes gene_type:complete